MKNFAVTGVAGYVAPRHLQAIKETNNDLVAACDPSDSVGILDRYFFEARYFREFERFDRHIEKLRRRGGAEAVDFVSICSPNYLHDAHVRFALRIGAHAICEKPLVINPWNLDALAELEAECGRRIFTILQLRMHPALVALRQQAAASAASATSAASAAPAVSAAPAASATPRKHEVVLTYVTARGNWYLSSWKGDPERSGGLATNIGIHFFDLLIWLFGRAQGIEVHVADPRRISGYLDLDRATVRFFLSIDRRDLPPAPLSTPPGGPTAPGGATPPGGPTTLRSITVDGREIAFSEGFGDLHTALYRRILAGDGFGVEDARPSIALAHAIRTAQPVGLTPRSHELARRTP